MTHIPPLDPNVAARKGFRESEERIKRFWKSAGIEAVVFDRGGNRYAGRVAAIADGAREGGLEL